MNISIYIHDFCGEDQFLIWDESQHNFGLCFQKAVLGSLSYGLLAVFSAFYIGKETSLLIRTKTQKAIIILRLIISTMLLLLAVLQPCLLSLYTHIKMFWVDIFLSSIQVFSWTLHVAYIFSLRNHLSRGTRGPKSVVIVWVLTLISTIISARTAWSISDKSINESNVKHLPLHLLRYFVTVQLGFQVLYLLTLFPRGMNDAQQSRSYERDDEHTPLLSSSFPTYGRFRETFDPFHLGTAEEGVNTLSYLTFHWVNLMMEKGNNKLLESVDDLYELPCPLRCEIVSQKVQKQILLSQPLSSASEDEETPPFPKYQLLKALHKCFGVRFYSLGLLKLAGDILSFTSPLLLNVLVQFVEKKENIQLWQGYAAGIGICLTTMLSAFFIVHFNYLMAKINIQLRASIVSVVFRKIQHLNVVNISKFSSGEIVNLMSTDTDRIINFCQSFHAFWSLPVQLVITLFLLYNQIGIAFLAGVLFALILIPINRFIAVKIAHLSKRMMHFKDKRLSFMSDILSRIKEVKLNSWENLFKKKVMDERYSEMKALSARKYLDAACVYFWASNPVLIPIITFGTYSALGNEMEPAKIFTAVALFNMMIVPLNAFPWVINGLAEAWVSMKRIERLMQMKEYNYDDFYTVAPDQNFQKSDVQILLLNANFSWNTTDVDDSGMENQNSLSRSTRRSRSDTLEEFYGSIVPSSPRLTLHDINVQIGKSQVIAVVGNVGSGKTALLYAILGELEKVSGVVSVAGLHQGFGLATQKPWLQNISLKENIMFGYNFEPSRFRSVIQSCALEEDIKSLPKGEDTRCGENGSFLSGGQKARVALARAVYQNKNIYLLDDVLSSVDFLVANHIMDQCIHKLLVGKTVVIVTHYSHLLTRVDWIIEMDNGKIKKQGPPSEVLSNMEEKGAASQPHPSGAVPRKTSKAISKKPSREVKPFFQASEKVPLSNVDCSPDSPTETESRSFGELNCAVYVMYLSACGVLLSVLVLFSFVLMQASRNLVDVWLAKWVSHDDVPFNGTEYMFGTKEGNLEKLPEVWPLWRYPLDSVSGMFSSFSNLHESKSTGQSTSASIDIHPTGGMDPANEFYFIVYATFAATNSIFTLMRAFLFAYTGLCAAKVLHKRLLDAVIFAKMSFFDLNPLGRILNRFSTDIYSIDDALPFQANILFAQLFGLLGSLVITIYGLPWIVLLYIPLMFIYYNVQQYYRHTSRDVRRIYNLSLSPLYCHFTETLQGQPVIRSHRATHRFGLMLDGLLEKNQQAQFGLMLSSQWLNLRLQLIGVGILAGVVLLALWEHHMAGINPGLVGLVISYALTISGSLNGVVTYLTETERELISVERVHQYLVGTVREGQSESFINSTALFDIAPSFITPPIALPLGWPNQGLVRFEHVYLKYHDHNPYSLRNITFTVNPCEKIGIVGRTGAGKSSLFMALFRLVEISRGKIFIDNVDISEVSIKKLRTSMAIVSQDVLLFTGSVRENLDPKGENLDREILTVIEQCHLTEILSTLGSLDSPLKGDEMSAGEKQLFCLARALLSRAKIICVDEGTGLLDKETEIRVHRVMRDAFRNKTVLIIAHRMHVIKDCDWVVVLSDGEITEIGRPLELIEDENSILSSIIHSQEIL